MKNSTLQEKESIHVSVIIPAFNAESTIADALQSLIGQTFSQWEAIIVDDGSTDCTRKIVQDFIERDKRIRLIEQVNKGKSKARNTGIDSASYNWLLFLDSDDWILPEHLEKLVNKISTYPYLDAAYCNWTYCTSDGHFIFESTVKEAGDLFAQHAGYCFSMIHTYLVRRSRVIEVGCFDSSLITCEDWDLWQKIARTGAQFGAVPEVLAVYRIRAGSATRDGLQLLKDGLQVIERGHSRDDRIRNPHPLHINGHSRKEISERKFELACACAGYGIGGGLDGRPLLQLVKDETCNRLNVYSIANCLYRYAMVSSSKPFSEWEQSWYKFEKRINDFLSALESLSGTPNLRKNAQPVLKNMIKKYSAKQGFFNKIHSYKSRIFLEIYRQPNPLIRLKFLIKRLLNSNLNINLSAKRSN